MVLDHWSNDAMVSMDRRGLFANKNLTIWQIEEDKLLVGAHDKLIFVKAKKPTDVYLSES